MSCDAASVAATNASCLSSVLDEYLQHTCAMAGRYQTTVVGIDRYEQFEPLVVESQYDMAIFN